MDRAKLAVAEPEAPSHRSWEKRMSHSTSSLSRRTFLTGGAAAGALILLHPFSARAQANQAHLRIMETTDIHVNVLPYDYYADKANDTMGLSRTASLIDLVR